MKLSLIIPSAGRRTLHRTLESVVTQPLQTEGPDADEVLVIGGPASAVAPFASFGVRHLPHKPANHWGCEERTVGIAAATGTHLAFLDDDDSWLPGARAAIGEALVEAPDRPQLFQIRYLTGSVLWYCETLLVGNVSTQMILIPNDATRLGRWTIRREGDYDFLTSMRWRPETILWRRTVIAQIWKTHS